MDVNLTGDLMANVSIAQSSQTDYLPLFTQIMTTLLTAGVTLFSVYLVQYLNTRSETKKHEEEEKRHLVESRKNAYQNFMEVFSSPIRGDIDWNLDFNNLTTDHLRVALNAVEFGDLQVESVIYLNISESKYEIKSLKDLVKVILELRYKTDLAPSDRINLFKSLRIQASERFGSAFLSSIISQGVEYHLDDSENTNNVQ